MACLIMFSTSGTYLMFISGGESLTKSNATDFYFTQRFCKMSEKVILIKVVSLHDYAHTARAFPHAVLTFTNISNSPIQPKSSLFI